MQGDQVLALNCSRQIEYSCIYADSEHRCISDYEGSVYARACCEGEVLLVEDLITYPYRTEIEDKLIGEGLRSFVVAPLHYQDDLIGTLSIGSPRPGDLHALNIMKLRDVLPLFAVSDSPQPGRVQHAPSGHHQRAVHRHSPVCGVALSPGGLALDGAALQ